jgi:hypothetical protein
MTVPIAVAVEGVIDEAVLRRLVTLAGGYVSRVYVGNGKPGLLRSLPGYNNAAGFSPWAVLVDLDQDCDCAPPCRQRWLAEPAPSMCFRVAVRAVEAWLLGDRERISDFLRVSVSKIPAHPEIVEDPKGALVDIARSSRSRRIRDEMTPRPEGGRRVGPLYASNIIQFVQDSESGWRPDIAANITDSLRRCLKRLACLVEANK